MAGRFPIPAAGPVAMVLHAGFGALLDALAEHHGDKPGPWLDALEEAVIKRAKNVVVEGMPMHFEAPLIEAGLRALKTVFEDYRNELSER